jgi:NAD(P)-dependent dehydrogenase (short-subunit alcohol dehydrogenase family)
LRVTAHLADVSDEAQVERFRDEAAERHGTDTIHLLFNNAGIGGGGSMFAHSREEWEKTFSVCWYGVYYSTRAFLPMLQKAEEGHIVNTSSVNGFWASVGPRIPHTAYSAAKFAVKGFTEALITDLRINAPHIKCSVVMPGHIGTSIPLNSRKIQSGNLSDDIDARQIAQARARIASMGRDVSSVSDDDIRKIVAERERRFREERRPARPRPRRSFSTGSRPTNGVSWSATTHTRSTNWSGSPQSALTISTSSRILPSRPAGASRDASIAVEDRLRQ